MYDPKAQIKSSVAEENLLAPLFTSEPQPREVRKGSQQHPAGQMATDQVNRRIGPLQLRSRPQIESVIASNLLIAKKLSLQ
jgi:hypothetical protein